MRGTIDQVRCGEGCKDLTAEDTHVLRTVFGGDAQDLI
jgi:hypothetical protein